MLSKHLAEAKRDEEAKKMRGKGKGKDQAGKENQQTREDEHALCETRVRKLHRRVSEIAPTMSEVSVAEGHGAETTKKQ